MSRTLRMTCPGMPVQYEGDIDGNPFYFRARYSAWSFDLVAKGWDPVGSAPAMREGKLLIHECAEYGEGPFDAGYMPHEEAEAIINRLLDRYEAGERGAVDGCSTFGILTPKDKYRGDRRTCTTRKRKTARKQGPRKLAKAFAAYVDSVMQPNTILDDVPWMTES